MKSNLHGAVMNLPCVVPAELPQSRHFDLKSGHRDARHQAAELVLLADAVVDQLAQASRDLLDANGGDEHSRSKVREALANLRGMPWVDAGLDGEIAQARRLQHESIVVRDLAMLCGRLIYALRRADPKSKVADQSLHYLRRKGLVGSPLRDAPGASEDADIGWHLVPGIGTRVEADHPITCLNPTKSFEVEEVRAEQDGRFSVRGADTCWFGVQGVGPATEPEAGSEESVGKAA